LAEFLGFAVMVGDVLRCGLQGRYQSFLFQLSLSSGGSGGFTLVVGRLTRCVMTVDNVDTLIPQQSRHS